LLPPVSQESCHRKSEIKGRIIRAGGMREFLPISHFRIAGYPTGTQENLHLRRL
jgi:hypothetical protein